MIVMPLVNQRRIAGDLMKCGVSRVRFMDEEAVSEALTREDIRGLIAKGSIIKIQKKGTTHGPAKKIRKQKAKGRRQGRGSRKGASGARMVPKQHWIRSVRGMRRALIQLKEREEISPENYAMLYGRIKGGMFRSKRHLMTTIKEGNMRIARKQ